MFKCYMPFYENSAFEFIFVLTLFLLRATFLVPIIE